MFFTCSGTGFGYTSSAEYDWVTGTDHRHQTYGGLKGVTKFGIAIENALNLKSVHATTAQSDYFISVLKDLKKASLLPSLVNESGETILFHSKTDHTKFYKLNDKFIISNHPQFDDKLKEINIHMPCN